MSKNVTSVSRRTELKNMKLEASPEIFIWAEERQRQFQTDKEMFNIRVSASHMTALVQSAATERKKH